MVCNYFTGIHLEQQITYSTALMHNLCLKGISQYSDLLIVTR